MIPDLMLPPQVFTIDTWEHPIDPFASAWSRIVKDKMRRIIFQESTPDLIFKLERRFIEEQLVDVKENLWRVVPGVSEWKELISIPLKYGKGSFEINSCTFSYSLEAINNKQVRFNVTYESWNVFAEEAGRLAFGNAPV